MPTLEEIPQHTPITEITLLEKPEDTLQINHVQVESFLKEHPEDEDIKTEEDILRVLFLFLILKKLDISSSTKSLTEENTKSLDLNNPMQQWNQKTHNTIQMLAHLSLIE